MFCTLNRALVSEHRGLGGQPLVAPWWRSLVGSALATGAVRWRVRASGRSFTGAVLEVGFSNAGAAVAFAWRWAGWCGLAIAMHRRVSGGQVVWALSVPCNHPAPRPHPQAGGQVWWVAA